VWFFFFFFFFSSRRRHTRFSRDWSSDVCSSDLASVFVLVLPRGGANSYAVWVAASVSGILSLLTMAMFGQVAAEGVLIHKIEWIGTLGLNLTLRMDGLAWLFAVLITVIGLLVVLYARYYMSPQDPIARLYALLMAFMGAMLGSLRSGHIIRPPLC